MAGNTSATMQNGPVMLRNVNINGFLVKTGNLCFERSSVACSTKLSGQKYPYCLKVPIRGFDVEACVKLPYESSFSADDAKWNLIPYSKGTYEIRHIITNTPLYAAGDPYNYDNRRRSVFTWVKGSTVTQGIWILEKCSNGYFKIKNKQHGEYLYAEDGQLESYVFTWRLKNNFDDDRFYWEVTHK